MRAFLSSNIRDVNERDNPNTNRHCSTFSISFSDFIFNFKDGTELSVVQSLERECWVSIEIVLELRSHNKKLAHTNPLRLAEL